MSECLRVYKFYSLASSLRNLIENRLKVSLIDELNDPYEFLGFSFPNSTVRRAWNKVRSEIWKDKGIICFSENWDNPVLWSHYADKHKGLALGFDVPKKYLLKVEYVEERPVFDFQNWAKKQKESATRSVLGKKYVHWSYEREQRIFLPLSECVCENGLWFRPFDESLQLKEVIIGARSSASSIQIREALGKQEASIVTARLSFRSFSVVKQLNKKLQK